MISPERGRRQVRAATRDDLPRLAATLAEAFTGDPVWMWMVPSPAGRRRLFGALLRHAIPKDHVYTAGEGRAVAMWAPPGQWRLPAAAMVRAAGPMVLATHWRLPRLLGRNSEIERLHEKVPAQHWYLEFIASTERGLGSMLMEHGIQTVTRGLPIYLESSNPRNLSFYERHGFEVTGEPPMRSGPPQWTLWRP
jgi:ribosomal protein S18 acetylase RimI-like enzyme